MKSKTHIYMANLLMQDLLDNNGAGQLKIRIGDFDENDSDKNVKTFIIPAEVREAILKNPTYFRGGSVGPDFVPDMIVGQMIIHPTDSGKWMDYLFKQLLKVSPDDVERPQIIAYCAGFMTHYAADLFGHDFVNGYAGGWFPTLDDIEQNPQMAAIVMKHILIESYMDERVKDQDLTIAIPTRFVRQCFTSAECMRMYPDNPFNALDYMADLSVKSGKVSMDTSNNNSVKYCYYRNWCNDVNEGIAAWIATWGNIASDTMSGDLTKVYDDVHEWFHYYFLKTLGFPEFLVDVLHGLQDVLNSIDVLQPLLDLIDDMIKKLVFALVNAVTGYSQEDFEQMLQTLKDMLNNPANYLKILCGDSIIDALDGKFGRYGTQSNTLEQDFKAFYDCLNMGKLCLLGTYNLNNILENIDFTCPSYKNQTCIKTIRNLMITVKTSNDRWSGTDNSIYFGVFADGQLYETVMDQAGNNDFERGHKDKFYFELPLSIDVGTITYFQIRKDYTHNSDEWKLESLTVTDQNSEKVIFYQLINKVFKDREPKTFPFQMDSVTKDIELDPAIVSFTYSLDGKGAGVNNPTTDKQWANDAFALYGNTQIRQKFFVPLFGINPVFGIDEIITSNYTSMFNDSLRVCNYSKLTGMDIHTAQDTLAIGITLIYDTDYNTLLHGQMGTSYRIYFASDEYITEIDYAKGIYFNEKAIGQITIKTNQSSYTYPQFQNPNLFFQDGDIVKLIPGNGKYIFALSGSFGVNSDFTNGFLNDLEIALEK